MTNPSDRLEILKQIKSKTIRVPGGKIIYAPEPSCYQWLIAELEQAWAREQKYREALKKIQYQSTPDFASMVVMEALASTPEETK